MLFDSFSSQAAHASLDSLWTKVQVISNNIANESTPGYKAQSVSFSQVLDDVQGAKLNTKAYKQNAVFGQKQQQDAGQNQYGIATGGAVAGGARYRTTITTDDSRSMRVDGNNVSMEKEQAELWKAQAQYTYLLDRVRGHYNSITTAISNMKG